MTTISRRRKATCTRRQLFALAGCAAFTGVATWAVFQAVLGLAVVKGSSMEPALREGDLLLIWRLGQVSRGDIVMLRTDDGTECVKRVIALPGESVSISERNGIDIDGKLIHEPYAYETTLPKGGITYPVKLNDDEYFVLGDNRANSLDSRNYGPISVKKLEGRATATFRRGG